MNPGDPVGRDRGQIIVDTGMCPSQGCENHVYVLEAVYWKLRNTHQAFFCPAGHSQSFRGPSETERKATEAVARAERAERERSRLAREAAQASRRCPWPTCEGRLLASARGLRQHMVKAHRAPWATIEVSAEEVGQVLNGRDPAEVVR